MTVAALIVIDKWKLDIFVTRLREAGYTFEECAGVSPGTLTLRVQTDNTIAVQRLAESAQRECALSRRGNS